jgi:hypothetical protein
MSDHNTPLIEPTPCNCSSWHSTYLTIDSTRRKLREVNYTLGGQNIKRSYFITLIDSTWTDVCDAAIDCKGTTRTRVTYGNRPWYTDVSTKCDLLSFTLPCCSDKAVNVKDIANIKYSGTCPPVFTPERLTVPTGALVASKVETVTVNVNGKTMTANITMINPDAKLDKSSPNLVKLTKINDVINDKFKPVLNRANDLLNKYLSYIGEWKSEVKLDFKIGGSASQICCADPQNCTQTSYSLSGDGKAGITGKVGIPVAGLPVVGKYLGGVDVTVKLGASVGLGVNGKTTCTDNQICTKGEGKVIGGGGFSFKVAGFKASGEVVVDGGGLSGELCVWPDVEVKCVKFNSGKLKLNGTVEDKWGWTQWNVEYVVWNGFSANLYGCK